MIPEMTLAEDYQQQSPWRDWNAVFDQLFKMLKCETLANQTVLDMGCGPGDLSAELVKRGARVIGLDVDEELLAAARARDLPADKAEFRRADLSALPNLAVLADGICRHQLLVEHERTQ